MYTKIDTTKYLHFNGDIVGINVPKMSYPVKVLPNRLCVIRVKIINPADNNWIDCDGLIDTGAEFSIICDSIFSQFKVDESKVIKDKLGIHSATDTKEKISAYRFNFILPYDNFILNSCLMGIRNLSHRSEYKIIIGMDMLDKCQFFYDGVTRQASLEC